MSAKKKTGKIAKGTKDPEAPYSEKTLPKGHPKRGEWNLAGKPSVKLNA